MICMHHQLAHMDEASPRWGIILVLLLSSQGWVELGTRLGFSLRTLFCFLKFSHTDLTISINSRRLLEILDNVELARVLHERFIVQDWTSIELKKFGTSPNKLSLRFQICYVTDLSVMIRLIRLDWDRSHKTEVPRVDIEEYAILWSKLALHFLKSWQLGSCSYLEIMLQFR
jgi:hypothetical protein